MRNKAIGRYPNIFLEILSQTMKNFSQNIQRPGRESNQTPSKYEAGVLTTYRYLLFDSVNSKFRSYFNIKFKKKKNEM
jgi:hypothetical protein